MILWATRRGPARLNSISVATACVSFASSVMSCAVSYIEHARSPRPSALLNVFLLVSVLLDAALLRTLWLSPFVGAAITGVFTASVGLKAALLVLEAVGKSRHLTGDGHGYSPEETAGIYGRAVFAWVAPLFRTGFRRLLTPADLFSLDEEMGTARLNERFSWNWKKHQPKSTETTSLSIFVRLLRIASFCRPEIPSGVVLHRHATALALRRHHPTPRVTGLYHLPAALTQQASSVS